MLQGGWIDVSGGKVWYERHHAEGEGTPLLVLHGGPGSSSYSLQVIKQLAGDRPVILYDQLGCGRSDWPENPSLWVLERFVEEVGEVRDALGLKDIHLLGHSWGTTLAAAYCLGGAVGVKSLVLSSPCLSAPLWAKDQERNLKKLPLEHQNTIIRCEMEGNTETKEYAKAVSEFNRRFVCRMTPYPDWLKAGAKYRNKEVYQQMWGPSEFSVKGNLKTFDCTNRLCELSMPVLYTCGLHDEATPETTIYYSSLTPGSQLHIFEKSAHMPYVEEQEEYMRVIGDFLSSVDHR